MALTVDEIAEIINSMREENENNAHSVERVLTGINNKLDMMAEDSEATDLIRVYISELKKSVDEKHSITVEKFNEIENSFNNLLNTNSENAKTSELRDLFNALGTNISNFSDSISSQKNILNDLDNKLSQVSERMYGKDEMASLISEVSLDISAVNSNLDNLLKNMEEKLSETVLLLNGMDSSAQFADIKNGIDTISSQVLVLPSSISRFQDIFESLREIISQLSSNSSIEMRERFESLENSFQNIVTDSDFKGFKADLADFVQKIIDNSSALNSELSYTAERIENILTTVKALDFRDDFENIISRVNDLKESFEEGSNLNYTNLSADINALSQNLDKSFTNLDDKRQEVYSSLKASLDNILSDLSTLSKNNNQEILDEISRSIISISNDVMSLRNGISADFQDDYGDLKAGLGNVITELQSFKNEIIVSSDAGFNSSAQNIQQIESRINDQISELSEIKNLISESNKLEPSQIIDAVDKVYENISLLVTELKEDANSNYEAVKGYIEELSQNTANLQSDFISTAEQNADKIISGITDVASSVEAFRDEFKQSALSNLENSSKVLDSVNNVSFKIDSVEQTLSVNARGNFESLKSILEELSQKMADDLQKQQDVFVQSNFMGDQQKLETLNKLADDIKAVENVLSSNIETFKSDVQANISAIKDYIGEINGSISTAQADSEAKLGTKLEAIEVLSHAFEASISSVHDEVKNVLEKIAMLDFSEQSSEIKIQLSNIVSASNSVLSSINEISTKNSELTILFSNMSEILASKEDVTQILDKLDILEKQDYSYDIEQLSSKIDDLSAVFETSSNNNYSGICEKIDIINENIQKNNNSADIIQRINDFSELISSIKNIISVSSEENKITISEQLARFEEMFAKVVNGEDFNSFRQNFSEFIQKILDNSNVLHINSEANKEQIESILEKIDTFNYSSDLENIAGRIDEIKVSFENNSKMNYENIVNAINNLKAQLNENLNDRDTLNKEHLDNFNSELGDLIANIELLRDFSSKNSVEILDRILSELHLISEESEQKIQNHVRLSADDLKLSITDMLNELNLIKENFTKKNDADTFNITLGFDNVKLSLENILSAFTSLNDDLKNSYSENSQNILADISDVSSKVEDLKNEIQHISEKYLERVYDAVNGVAEKVDAMSEGFSEEIVNNLTSFRDLFERLSNELKVIHEESVQQIKDDNELQLAEIKTLSGNLDGFKNQVNDAVESLKLYISELDANTNSSQTAIDNKLTEKLLDLEAGLSHVSEEYEQKMEILQGKLSEFVQIVENSTSDTEAKIASSLEEITDLKSELSLLSNALKSIKISADEKFTESMSVIDTGIENIINNIKTLDSEHAQNVEQVINNSLAPMDEQLSKLLDTIADLKSEQTASHNKDLIAGLEEQISGVKQEIGLVNTDISDALQCKAEEILRAFEPVKTEIEELRRLDFDKLIGGLKSQLENSFMSFSVDVNGEIASASESMSRLEQAYKETFEKISVIEDTVCGKIQDDMALLNSSLEKSVGAFTHSLDEKLDEYLSDLKAHLEVISNNSGEQTIKEMSFKLDKIDDIQNSIEEQAAAMSVLDNNIKNYVQSFASKSEEKELLQGLHDKVDIISLSDRTDEILSSIDEIEENFEERNNSLKSDISLVHEKLDSNASADAKLSDMISALHEKADILALSNSNDDEILNSIEDVVSTENKLSDMLSALHDKVDVLAMGNSDSDLLDEIDDIKDLIFEQRKYFEASSDEKSAAIDKYLRDVLLKLDNLDLEKNSEDLKDSIMNALVSLFDQISFVEETEEIKDFVEEKTDEIKENLIKVQTQLHQIASSNDDFDYSYTLQDVESDIAKLRLAMNQISAGADFEGLSEGIKKIVNSVEGLESSLTQDQIVDLKGDIEKLNEDILSISSRTNKLLLTSDESYKALNDGLNNFSSLVYRLEDRINDLDKTQISDRLERKLDSVHSMAVASANADKVFHQVMMYLGEWIDSTTENISSITDKTSEISGIKEQIDELRNVIPERSQLLDELQLRFEKQEERIDELETKLDKILSTLEEKDDMVLNRKVDKIEKMLSRLGSNIEKLTSYVDEE